MKKAFFLVLFLCSLFSISAQVIKRPDAKSKDWRILEKAQVAFDGGKYGDAVNLANAAKDSHVAEIKWEESVLNKALSPSAVQKAGDEFAQVLAVLKERDEYTSIDLINSYLNKYGQSYFGNSVKRLASWIQAKSMYPEADFLLGQIYRLEGEYTLASQYYEQARENAKYLDIPDARFDILYAMAELAHDQNDLETYEQTLLLILNEDTYYSNSLFMNALVRTIDSNNNKSFEKFFMLYRSEPNHSILALAKLEELYEARGQSDEALKCTALSVSESFTHMLAAITDIDSEYHYTDFASFLTKAGKYDEIVSWANDNKVWQMMYELGVLSEQRGKTVFANSVYTVLSSSLPDQYWKAEAEQQLIKQSNTSN